MMANIVLLHRKRKAEGLSNMYCDYKKNIKLITDIMALTTVPMLFVWGILYSYGIYGSWFISPLIFFVAFWVLYYIATHRNYTIPRKAWYLFFGAVTVVISSVVNAYILQKNGNSPNSDNMIFLYIDVAALIIASILYICKRECFELGIHMLSCFVLLTGAYGYVSYLRNVKDIGWLYRPYSIYGNPIPAGHMFLIFLWVPLIPSNSKLNAKFKKLDIVLRWAIYVPFIFLTQSRSIWMGVIFTLILFCVHNFDLIKQELKNMSKKVKGIIAVSVVGVFAVCFPHVKWVLINRFSNIKGQQPYRLRINYIKYTFEQIAHSNFLQQIFGHGVATSRDMIANSPYIEEEYNICDNAYMSMLYEWGIIPIIIVVVIDIFAFRILIKNAKSVSDYRDAHIWSAYVLMACVIPTFFYDVQMWYTVMIPILLFVPIVVDGITGKMNIAKC